MGSGGVSTFSFSICSWEPWRETASLFTLVTERDMLRGLVESMVARLGLRFSASPALSCLPKNLQRRVEQWVPSSQGRYHLATIMHSAEMNKLTPDHNWTVRYVEYCVTR